MPMQMKAARCPVTPRRPTATPPTVALPRRPDGPGRPDRSLFGTVPYHHREEME